MDAGTDYQCPSPSEWREINQVRYYYHDVFLYKVRRNGSTRVMRQSMCFIALILAVALAGCSRSSASQSAVLLPPPAKIVRPTATAVPTVLPTRTPNVVANPIRLIITSIGINASVEQVGMLSNGDMATPTQNPWENVGWYKAGTHPGERGSAVIDGHLDRPGGYQAVFWYLQDLHIGDAVLVVNADGKTLHFRVTRIELYAPQAAPIQDIFGNRGGTYLNLITCAGDWIPNQHQYNLRLVVYTTLG